MEPPREPNHHMKTYIVDSFTDTPFHGNPAGVCLVEEQLADDFMLSIARELGLSETAFIERQHEPDVYLIRYFSPKMEIRLCGHATLASAKVLFTTHNLDVVRFFNRDNLELVTSRSGGDVKMEFPVYDTRPATVPAAMLAALGVDTVENVVYNEETKILLLEIRNPTTLAHLDPDFTALVASHNSINGVLVTAPSQEGEFDFHSRYFWPWSGTDEDPATGGTHTFLTPYWSTRLGKTKMKSFQSSRRTGQMVVELIYNKLFIIGSAVIVFEGEL